MPHSHLVGVAATVQNEMQKHAALLQGVLTHKERKAVSAFIQAPEDYFDAEPTFKQSYAPQSGEIFGILKQMKETFESNLSSHGGMWGQPVRIKPLNLLESGSGMCSVMRWESDGFGSVRFRLGWVSSVLFSCS